MKLYLYGYHRPLDSIQLGHAYPTSKVSTAVPLTLCSGQWTPYSRPIGKKTDLPCDLPCVAPPADQPTSEA